MRNCIHPTKIPVVSYLWLRIFAACHKATVPYLSAAVFYHNPGIRLSLRKMVWSVLWHPLVWNVPWKCKSCHWLSRSSWPSKSVLPHYCGKGGQGGQQGKAKEKSNFSFHLKDSCLQASIQYPSWIRGPWCCSAGGHGGEHCPCSCDTAQAVLSHPMGRLFSLWVMLPTNTEILCSLDSSRHCFPMVWGPELERLPLAGSTRARSAGTPSPAW